MKTIEMTPGRSVSIAAGSLACLFLLTGIAFPQSAFPKTPGVWLSGEPGYRPTSARVEGLTQSLRRITGLNELHFEEDGSLVIGPAQTEGSATARQILSCALSSGFVFIIEDHSDSPSVNFGQLNEGLRYEDAITGVRLMVWRVRLDFDDFREMQASREVQASFDAGFTTLHELLHGLGYKDATSVDELGECEERLNRARAELGLPLRDQYFGDTLRLAQHFVSVRLRFRSDKPRISGAPVRSRTQYLFFLVQSDYEQQSMPAGAPVYDCGNRIAFQHKGSKDQSVKRLKGE
ncbi:MAG: hypothetical protein MOB07_09255 [Acidobacteria bacterium]|nr:hypothetical protein [Acidobacteriota bacterium]